MENQELAELLDKYKNGTASEMERAIVESWYNQLPFDAEAPGHVQILESKESNWELIAAKTLPVRKTIKLWPRIAIAAAVATIIFGAGLFFYNNRVKQDTQTATVVNDMAPGKQGATLTLASGKKISLSDAANGELAKEAGVVISKSADGELVYEIKGSESEPNKINTLSTAKGETYQLRLPDGSLVWLNAASSLTYSANLNERGKRRVRLDGEGYFEIAKDKAHPFVVETRNQQIQVLGTHFNVNGYGDETVTRTSLLEGSVRINGKEIMKPGDLAVTGSNKSTTISKSSVEDAVAWKNGKFVFEYEPIEGVMRKLARWYDAEIIYQGNFEGKTFTGSISRFDNISKILNKITYSQEIHFKIEGRRITVMD